MIVLKNTVRSWLIESHYEEIAILIDEIIAGWEKEGNKQRRNWWDVLAGDKNGNSRIIAGRKIPVLKAAQVRKGMKVTPNAITNGMEKPVIGIRKLN